MKLQVTMPAGMQSAMTRFDAMSLRERMLIGIALISSLLVMWDSALMGPLNAKRAALMAVLEDPNSIQSNATQSSAVQANALPVDVTAPTTDGVTPVDGTAVDPDPIGTALLQRESLRTNLADIDKQLQQISASLIAPERMSEVLYDVLRQQQGVTLISLRNKPVVNLAPVQTTTDNTGNAVADAKQSGAGPYLHPVELVIDGRYLDILDYLRALEALPWHLNWQSLQLDSSHYPLSRARIELSTLSLDPAWMGT